MSDTLCHGEHGGRGGEMGLDQRELLLCGDDAGGKKRRTADPSATLGMTT